MGMVRLELTWISPPPPQDGASAISPHPHIYNVKANITKHRLTYINTLDN